MSFNGRIPTKYRTLLDQLETEKAIKLTKDFFEVNLAESLNLRRVTAPLLVKAGTGINDDLNGVEQPISFKIKSMSNTSDLMTNENIFVKTIDIPKKTV